MHKIDRRGGPGGAKIVHYDRPKKWLFMHDKNLLNLINQNNLMKNFKFWIISIQFAFRRIDLYDREVSNYTHESQVSGKIFIHIYVYCLELKRNIYIHISRAQEKYIYTYVYCLELKRNIYIHMSRAQEKYIYICQGLKRNIYTYV